MNRKQLTMKTRILLFLLFLTSAGLGAETINIEQVRILALAHSRSLAKSNLAIQSVVLDEKSRVFSNLPSLSLGASASMNLWNAANAPPVNNPFDTFGAGVNFSASQKNFRRRQDSYSKGHKRAGLGKRQEGRSC